MSAPARALKIAVLSASYAPEPTGIGPYSAELAEALASRGHVVRVVAAFPFYPAWRSQVPKGTFLHRTERLGGVQVTRCRIYVPRNPRPVRRLVHEVSWIFAALGPVAQLLGWADVWVVVSPSFGSAVLGAFLRRVFRARVHLHIQDVVPDVAMESGQLGPGLAGLVKRVARWTYRSFPSSSVLSESMAVRLRAHTGGAVTRQLIAPNWVRRSAVPLRRPPERLAGRPYALYAGSFGRKQDLTLLTEAAGVLAARHGPAIVVLGDGPGRDLLTQAGAGVVWLGLVDEATYASILENALAGIVALAPGVGDSVVPSKLAAYLGAGRPVVVAADVESEAARVVTRSRCGFLIAPGRADQLADRLWQLAHDEAAWQAFAKAGRTYAQENWQKDTIVRQIEAALVKTAQGN